MNQANQSLQKTEMKFGKKSNVRKGFMDTAVTRLYNQYKIVSLTIIPSKEKDDTYDLLYVYEK